MDAFASLKHRTASLLHSVQQAVPAMPSMPSIDTSKLSDLSRLSIKSLTAGHPQSLKATWEPLTNIRIPRSSHTVDVVQGTAFIFGGEVTVRQPVDNQMVVVTLPSGSGTTTDVFAVNAVATATAFATAASFVPDPPAITIGASLTGDENSKGGLTNVPLTSNSEDALPTPAHAKGDAKHSLPPPRIGHASAVIGRRIFIFGGRGGPEMKALQEAGRVWVFDTRSHTWTFLDPAPARSGNTQLRFPASRSYHSAVSLETPRDFATPTSPTQSWRQWAEGDRADVGTPQAPIVGHLAAKATDENSDGYGTLLIYGGCVDDGRANDLWAFDVRSRVWSELPAAPGPARGGTALCVCDMRLYRFGGFDGHDEIGGQLDFLDLEAATYNDGTNQPDLAVVAQGLWKTLVPDSPPSPSQETHSTDMDRPHDWPGPRSVAGFNAVSAGGGRQYLVLVMGERHPSPDGHQGAGRFWDDVWAFRVPAHGATAAAVTDAFFSAVGLRSVRPEAGWVRVETRPYNDELEVGDKTGAVLPRARGWLATAPMPDLDGGAILLWGGLGEDNERLGDGWILRLD